MLQENTGARLHLIEEIPPFIRGAIEKSDKDALENSRKIIERSLFELHERRRLCTNIKDGRFCTVEIGKLENELLQVKEAIARIMFPQ